MFENQKNRRPRSRSIRRTAAKEKFDEFRMHAEFAAVFEATRKFEAQILPTLDAGSARDLQKRHREAGKIALPDSPLLSEPVMKDAAEILDLPATKSLSTNDYHIYRRPGEVMILRWLAGEEVETFYQRMQAHFEAALNRFARKSDRRTSGSRIRQTLKYLDAPRQDRCEDGRPLSAADYQGAQGVRALDAVRG